MRLLLFGKTGQLGWELQRSLAPLGELVALGARKEPWASDFLEPQHLAATVRAIAPQVVVNAAAWTAVDRAELEPDVATRINAVAPGMLAQAAAQCGALMVHFSSDYVFDGAGSRAWTESDPPAPLNAYGHGKLEGERLVAAHCPHHLILRTSWLYAARGENFANTVLRRARQGETLRVVDDQHGAPTGAELVADVTAHALRAALAEPAKAGLYHVSAAGETSWYGYARHVLSRAQVLGMSLATQDVQPVSSLARPALARRPSNSRLDCARLEAAFGLRMPPWQVGVDRMLQELVSP